jgi:hypothetical protein
VKGLRLGGGWTGDSRRHDGIGRFSKGEVVENGKEEGVWGCGVVNGLGYLITKLLFTIFLHYKS